MIERLQIKNKFDVYDFCLRCKDKHEDWYITKDKSRLMINKLSLIEQILTKYEVYGVIDKELKAVMIIVKDKGYRPYIKVLAESNNYYYDLMMYLRFNFMNRELFAKLKINNPLVEILKRKGFINIGMRGREVLLHKKAIKEIYRIIPKDDYLIDEENKLY